MRGAWVIAAGLVAALAPASATAQHSIFGYELGLTETAAAVLSDNAQLFVSPTGQDALNQLSTFQLTTTLTANATLDLVGQFIEHAFMAGGSLTSLLPLTSSGNSAVLDQGTVGVQATAGYVGRVTRATYSFNFGGGYTFGLNGILPLSASGGVTTPGAGTPPTLPGQEAGFLVLNGQTHTVTAQTMFLKNGLRWDLDVGAAYSLQVNGILPINPALAGAAQGGTSAGAFVQATTHTVMPSLNYRRRVGNFSSLNSGLSGTLVLPASQSVTSTAAGAILVPRTAAGTLTVGYLYDRGLGRSYGIEGASTVSFREPTLLPGSPSEVMRLDTVISTLRAIYNDELRALELRLGARAGVAQVSLFQPPLGQVSTGDDTQHAFQPVVQLTAQRTFSPFDLGLLLERSVAPGGLGASAVISYLASLTLRSTFDLGSGYALLADAGFNMASTRPIGSRPEQAVVPGLALLTAASDSVGALASVLAPLFQGQMFRVEASLSYNFTYAVPTPQLDEGELGYIPGFSTHNVFATLRLTFGRGTAGEGAEAGRDSPEELSAFEANPRTGAPLISARLMNMGRAFSENGRGSIPGRPAPVRRDSRRVTPTGTGEQPLAPGGLTGQRGQTSAEVEEQEAREKTAEETNAGKKQAPPPSFDTIPEEDLVRPLRPPPPQP